MNLTLKIFSQTLKNKYNIHIIPFPTLYLDLLESIRFYNYLKKLCKIDTSIQVTWSVTKKINKAIISKSFSLPMIVLNVLK